MSTFLIDLGQQFMGYVAESLAAMNWVNVLDVLFMTAFLSFGLALFQRRTARSILFAIFPLLVTFVAASHLNMYLTSKLLQMGLTIFGVGLVIVFQEDFRRAFESLSSWKLWSRGDSFLSAEISDTLVECLFEFSKSKTGALIVIGGRQPLEQHLRAGISLNGKISGPLLESIFDPNSAGHDGAVIILNGLVERFGAHLPLSREVHHTGRLGTRHAAALGLVEKCDALVLVVSEETGAMSLGFKGKLKKAESVSEVRDAIRAQSKRLKPAPHRSLIEIPWMRLAASLILSFALWTTFAKPAPELAKLEPSPAAQPPEQANVPHPPNLLK